MKRTICLLLAPLLLLTTACAPYWDAAIGNTYAYLGLDIPKDTAHSEILFSEIPFGMPDTDALAERIEALHRSAELAGEDALSLQAELESLYDSLEEAETMASLAYVHHCLDTENPVWRERSEKLNGALDGLYDALNKAALSLSARPELKSIYDEKTVARLRAASGLYDPSIRALLDEEREQMDAYDRMQMDFTITVDGQSWSLSDLTADESLPFIQWYALYKTYVAAFSQKAAELYLSLIGIRKEIAAELGFSDYSAYRYAMYGREYTPQDAELLSADVAEIAAPLYCSAVAETAKDREALLAASDAYPQVQTFDRVRALLGELDPSFLEPWDYLVRNELYDCSAGEKKLPGSFTTYFATYGAPYLYLNWDDSYAMPTTLLHEFGHFAGYYFRTDRDASGGSLDLAEIDSQGLELLAISRYKTVFGNRADEAKTVQLCNALYAVVSGCALDAFERFAYSADDLTADRLHAAFDSIVKEYGLDHAGFSAQTWTQIPHLFRSPGYYISYAVSAIVALELYAKSLQSERRAVSAYRKLLNRKDIVLIAVLRDCGLTDPFADGTIQSTLKEIYQFPAKKEWHYEKGNRFSYSAFASAAVFPNCFGRRRIRLCTI